MITEKIKNFLDDVSYHIPMFLWNLLPASPIFAQLAIIFLPVASVWFWILVVATIIPIIIVRPAICSCSQWENIYTHNIAATLGFLIVRLCGFFPI